MTIKEMQLQIDDLVYELKLTNNAMGNEQELLQDSINLQVSVNNLTTILGQIVLKNEQFINKEYIHEISNKNNKIEYIINICETCKIDKLKNILETVCGIEKSIEDIAMDRTTYIDMIEGTLTNENVIDVDTLYSVLKVL